MVLLMVALMFLVMSYAYLLRHQKTGMEDGVEVSDYERSLADHNANKALCAEYLCRDCARLLGGEWPKGHRATFHPARCPVCNSYRPVACWSDWDWPNAPEMNGVANRSRET